jgi:hypothetical protein
MFRQSPALAQRSALSEDPTEPNIPITGLLALALAATLPAYPQMYTVDPPGSTSTYAEGINASGAVTGSYRDAAGVAHGFLRDASGNITSFDPPGSVSTSAYGVNASGAVTGYYQAPPSVAHGFIRDASGNFTSFDVQDSTVTYAYSVNASGAVTGPYFGATGAPHGFLRDTSGNITSFDPPGSTSTYPYSINANGGVTGSYYGRAGVPVGFIRDASGSITSFHPPGSASTYAYSINASGAVTGYYVDRALASHGFLRDPSGNFTSFDPPSSTNTYVYSISTSGAVTGYYQDRDSLHHGFLRDASGDITSFDPPGSAYTSPYSLNISAAIAGTYQDANRVYHGFVGRAPNGVDISKYTTPAPIPASAWQSAIIAGVSNVVVQAWDGLAQNMLANAQLTGAQSSGLNTGAYLLLTYFSNRPPQYQAAQAVQAIGSAITSLKFMAVDVETCCGEFVNWKASTSYVAGAQIMDPSNHIQIVTTAGTSGTTPPAWNDTGGTTTDGTVTWQDTGNVVVNQSQRVAYISNAVSYINKQYPNLHVAIYTSADDWQTITGNCGSTGTNPCPSLINLPLWDVEHKLFTQGNGSKHLGDGVAGLVPWTPWSSTTWQTRNGNQYDWGSCTTAGLPLEQNPDPEARPAATSCGNNSYFGLNAVDLDYFNPSLLQ